MPFTEIQSQLYALIFIHYGWKTKREFRSAVNKMNEKSVFCSRLCFCRWPKHKQDSHICIEKNGKNENVSPSPSHITPAGEGANNMAKCRLVTTGRCVTDGGWTELSVKWVAQHLGSFYETYISHQWCYIEPVYSTSEHTSFYIQYWHTNCPSSCSLLKLLSIYFSNFEMFKWNRPLVLIWKEQVLVFAK